MIPRSLRLTRAGFENAKKLSRASSAHFSFSYGVAEPGLGGTAVIVAKKGVRGSVERHALKRRIRAVLRPWSSRERVLIVTARAGALELPFAEIERELSLTLQDILGEQHA